MRWFNQSPRRTSSKQEIADLEKLPPVTADFTTPEGAILCLEAACARKDLEAAVACRDFVAEATWWLRGRQTKLEKFREELLAELTKSMEKSFRQSMNNFPPGWDKARSYFVERASYGEGLVVVSEITVGPDRSLFRQRILTSLTPSGWRVVTPLVETPNG